MKKKPFVLIISGIVLVLSVSFLFSLALRSRAVSSELFEVSGTTLVRYLGESEEVVIPGSIKTIGKGAFEGNHIIKKISIPSSVDLIEYNAFSECSELLEVDIPDSVTQIGSSAFANCRSLCDVSVGKGLKAIGSGIFAGCDSLSDIKINSKNIAFTCVDGVLYSIDRTIIYQVLGGREKPYYIMPKTVEQIGQYAFWGNHKIKHVQLSENLSAISAYAFSNATALQTVSMSFNMQDINMKAFEDCIALEQIYIPDSVRYIHETAFDGCTKLSIYANYYSKGATFASENGISWIEYAKYPLNQAEIAQEEYFVMQKKEKELEKLLAEQELSEAIAETEKGLLGKTSVVGNNAVVLMDRFEAEVCLGDNVRATEEIQKNIIEGKLADNLFYMRSDLKEIVIPNDVHEIGKFAFARSGLEKIVIPEGVTSIEYGAFYHCSDLADVSIPSTVTYIDKNAFEYTAWLQNWYKESKEDYLIVGDGVLLAYKGDVSSYKKPSTVKCVACEIPSDAY